MSTVEVASANTNSDGSVYDLPELEAVEKSLGKRLSEIRYEPADEVSKSKSKSESKYRSRFRPGLSKSKSKSKSKSVRD